MNSGLINDHIKGAITSIPVSQWKRFFENARQIEYATLTGTPDSELTNVKQRVKIIDELESLFTTARQQTVTHNENDENDT